MGIQDGFIVNNDYTSGQYARSTSTLFPLDAWSCIQFEMPSGTAGVTRIAVDGVTVGDVTLTKAMAQPQPTHAYFGLVWVGTPSALPAADVWLDELIVDSASIGCAE